MRLGAVVAWVLLFSGVALLRGADATNAAPISAPPSPAPDPLAPYEHWITGDVLLDQNALFFRTDRPVRDNVTKDVVVLAVTAEGGKVLLPFYIRAAQRHVRVRLFGALIPYRGGIQNHVGPLPSVEFLTWKAHAPTDPDVLPANQRIAIDGGLTTMGNVPVTLVDDKTGKPLSSQYKVGIKPATASTSTNQAP